MTSRSSACLVEPWISAVRAVIPRCPSICIPVRRSVTGCASPLIHGPAGEGYLHLCGGEYVDSMFVMHPNVPIQLSDLPWPQGRAERRAGASLIRDNSPRFHRSPALGAYQRRLLDGRRARGARERPARPKRLRPASRQRSVSAAVSREDRELLAELARINTLWRPWPLRIMEGSASAAEQTCYAQRLIAAGERLRRRANGPSGVVIEGEVLADK